MLDFEDKKDNFEARVERVNFAIFQSKFDFA